WDAGSISLEPDGWHLPLEQGPPVVAATASRFSKIRATIRSDLPILWPRRKSMIRSSLTASTAVAFAPIPALPHRSEISIISDEPTWRGLPLGRSGAESPSRLLVTRWQAIDMKPMEHSSETPEGQHIVKIIRTTAHIRLSINSKTVHDALAMPGMFHVTARGTKAGCLFRGPYDNLHLHVPNKLIVEYARDIAADPTAPLLSTTTLTKDPMIERLGRALLAADQI